MRHESPLLMTDNPTLDLSVDSLSESAVFAMEPTVTTPEPTILAVEGDALSTSILQLVANSLSELAGFELVRICLMRPDGLRNAVVTGTRADKDVHLGALTPLETLIQAEKEAVDLGSFKFLASSDRDDARWREGDLLYAPLYDDQRTLNGVVALDRPLDGRRPQPHQHEVINRHAEAAARAVRTVLERERLADEVRLTELARDVVRAAARGGSIDVALETAAPDVLETLDLDEFGVAVVEGDGVIARSYRHDGLEREESEQLRAVVARGAARLWPLQDAAVITFDEARNAPSDPGELQQVRDDLRAWGHGSVLYAPIGAGDEAFGLVVLFRREGGAPWSDLEVSVALDIGRDLGLVVHNSRALRREQELAAQLREVDASRSRLISTVAHELRNPLTSILGFLDLLEAGELARGDGNRAATAIERSVERMQRIVGDLGALSEAGGASGPMPLPPLDLGLLARDVGDLVEAAAARRGVRVAVELPQVPVTVLGDEHQLDQALANLVNNAVKYSDRGGRVSLTVRADGEHAEVSVHDDGIGIGPEDQSRLFQEFFRSTNPEALARPGTGLGLVIARRIIERHGGTIDVESSPGEGSTFVIRLPRAHA